MSASSILRCGTTWPRLALTVAIGTAGETACPTSLDPMVCGGAGGFACHRSCFYRSIPKSPKYFLQSALYACSRPAQADRGLPPTSVGGDLSPLSLCVGRYL